jgi:cation transport ATPase
MFIETMIGIFREHLLVIMEGNAMKNRFITLRPPALISLLLVIPFMVMEVVNRRGFDEGFPIPLFAMMWILPVIFILTGMPILRNLRAGSSLMTQPVNLLIRVVVLVLVAVLSTGLLLDQMPCFLGVPNCD